MLAPASAKTALTRARAPGVFEWIHATRWRVVESGEASMHGMLTDMSVSPLRQ